MKLHPAVRFLAFALLLLVISTALSSPSSAQIGVGVAVRFGPPALPIYAQPLCPGPGYFWTPGYWAWNDDAGYYWVPGTWIIAPVGLLWTPGYWGWGGGFYAWHPGYWGPHVGFYGGINYGFGYGGVGFFGGEWRGGAFFYNTAVVRVDTVHVTNVYTHTVVVNNESHVAFNGGEGGVAAHATAAEESAAREPHQAALATQTQHEHAASQNRALFASENHGAPAVAATARPGEFSGHGVVAAKAGAEYHAPSMSPKEARAPAAGPNRPFTPPAKNGSRAQARENKSAGSNPRYENNKDKTASEPKSTPRSESRSESAPKSKPAKQGKAPKHQNPPREEKREKGR